jgi:hypothetical protein
MAITPNGDIRRLSNGNQPGGEGDIEDDLRYYSTTAPTSFCKPRLCCQDRASCNRLPTNACGLTALHSVSSPVCTVRDGESGGPWSGLMKAGNRGFYNIRWFTLFGLLECRHCVSICLSSLDLAVLIVRAFNKLFGSKARSVKVLPAIDNIACGFAG